MRAGRGGWAPLQAARGQRSPAAAPHRVDREPRQGCLEGGAGGGGHGLRQRPVHRPEARAAQERRVQGVGGGRYHDLAPRQDPERACSRAEGSVGCPAERSTGAIKAGTPRCLPPLTLEAAPRKGVYEGGVARVAEASGAHHGVICGCGAASHALAGSCRQGRGPAQPGPSHRLTWPGRLPRAVGAWHVQLPVHSLPPLVEVATADSSSSPTSRLPKHGICGGCYSSHSGAPTGPLTASRRTGTLRVRVQKSKDSN